jgi:transposase
MGGNEKDLPTVYVPEKKVREMRSLISTYRLLGKMATQAKNRIHSLLKQNGICIDKRTIDRRNFIKFIESAVLPDMFKYQIWSIFRQLKNTDEEQDKIKDMIYLLGNEIFDKEIKLLLSIRGFSVFTAIVLMSDVADVDRFKNHKKFCSYLRTAPKTKSSNNTINTGKANKQSRSASCALLTQSVLHFKVAGDHMAGFYNRVRAGKSAGKSRLALIRKILVSAYHMLNKEELYYWAEEEKYKEKLLEYERGIRRIKNSLKKELLKKTA